MRPLLFLIVFAALIAMPGAAQATAVDQPVAQAGDATAPCPFPIPAGEVVGVTLLCGEVVAPENWAVPGAQEVTIRYAVLKSPNRSPFPDPIIYLEGGPGSSALAGLPFLRDTFPGLRQSRDIIIYDQRGNSYSTPLVCPDEVAGQPVDVPEQAADFVASLDSDLDQLVVSAKNQGIYQLAVNCAPYFAEQQIDLTQYSTANSVQDLIALMRTLGYAEYNLYGISYGTNVALELLRYYGAHEGEELPALRSGVIDGNVPPNADTRGGQAYATPNNILRLFAECEADAACGAAFPDIRRRAIDLIQQAADAPLVIGDETISANDLRQVMGAAMIFKLDETNPDVPVGLGAAYLPLMVDELEQGVADTYLGLRDGTLPAVAEAAPPANPLATIASEATSLADETRVLADKIDALSRESRRSADALASGLPLPAFFLAELRSGVAQMDSMTAVFFPTAVQIAIQTAPPRDALLSIAGSVNQEVAALVPLMTDDELAAALALVQEALPTLKSVNEITNVVIVCNDRYASLDLERIFAGYRSFEATPLVNKIDVAVNEKVACEAWGLTPAGTDLAEPVVSSLTILVSSGSMDGETPVEWSEAAAAGLEKAFMVTFTYAQHGASTQFECGPAVTNAFFMYPERMPDTACADELRERFPWVLPETAP